MKALCALLLLCLLPFSKTSAQEFVLPPFTTDVPCYDGSAYTLNVRLVITGIRVVTVYSDNGSSGSFSFELLFEYINNFTGTVGNGAASFYTYEVTFHSDNPNLASSQFSNNLQLPLVSDTGDNVSLHNNNTYNGSASAMGLTANTTYNSQSVINLFGFDSVHVTISAPCLTVAGGAVPVTPLPVTLSTFSVNQDGDALVLNWATQQERNNKGFQVQKSRDGKTWSNLLWIGSQAPDGNSNEDLRYTTRDLAPFPGDNIYRLLQTDRDGRTEISRTVRCNFTNGDNYTSGLMAYPVPANDLIRVRYSDPALIPDQVNLFDMNGKRVLSYKPTGTETTVDLSQFPNGSYWLQSGAQHLRIAIVHY